MVGVTSPGPLGFTYVLAMSAANETVTCYLILFELKSVSLALLPLYIMHITTHVGDHDVAAVPRAWGMVLFHLHFKSDYEFICV